MALKGADINVVDYRGIGLIFGCIFLGNLDVLKCLVSLGCDINQGNQNDRSPIYKSIYFCKEDLTEYLLTLPGLNLTKKDENERNCLHMACWGSYGSRTIKKD